VLRREKLVFKGEKLLFRGEKNTPESIKKHFGGIER